MPSVKRKAITVKEKLAIIQKVDSNPSASRVSIAKELGLPASTLNSIVSKREILLREAANTSSNCKKRKLGKYEDVEKPLLEWFKQQRAQNIPLNGSIIKEKAEQIALRLGIEFQASNGWIDRFKNRYGIVYKCVSGESASVDKESTDSWVSLLPTLISEYSPKDVFNVDEFGLFFNMLPDRTLTLKGENCHGGKLSKERLTVLAGANMDGSEKLPLLVIGKPKKPRCFKNIKTLPCRYVNNKSAWMTCSIFEEYLHSIDAKMGCKNRKILLFMDHCPAHPKIVANLRNITLQFLPPNSTSVLQPMDQGIIKVLKQMFRKRLVCRIIQRMKPGCQPHKLNILDAMHLLAASWDSIAETTIKNCFTKAGFIEEESPPLVPEVSEDAASVPNSAWNVIESTLNVSCSFESYTSVDDSVQTCASQDIEDICAEQEEECDDEEDEDDAAAPPKPSCSDATECVDRLKHFLACTTDAPSSIWSNLWNLENYVLSQAQKNCKQKKINDFFV